MEKEDKNGRDLFFHGLVDMKSMQDVIEKIVKFNKEDDRLSALASMENSAFSKEPIKIWIDSYGGHVYSCLGLLSVMESSKTPIHTIVTGCAFSCGFMIAICGHKRFSHKYSTFMYHQVSDNLWGKVEDIKQDLVETERLQKIIEDITLHKTKIKKAKLKSIREGKIDWYITSEEALLLGVIDKII